MSESRVSKMERRMRTARITRREAATTCLAVFGGLLLAGLNSGVWNR
jgi:hypothetical protein